jgi:group II intron reverse transcriptase/maturase
VIDCDISAFFDNLRHSDLLAILRKRVNDGRILELVEAWLEAGIMDGKDLVFPEKGSPQGSVISPLLANVYLHEVLDTWWEIEVKPRLNGRAILVRYADDFVLVFEREADARRVQAVLPKRFEKYGLQLHPEKTRLVKFERPRRGDPPPGQFDLLGFTHRWERSRRGFWVVRRTTAKSRLRRGIQWIAQWCRTHRHLPIQVQRQVLRSRLQGHYAYFGITGNWWGLQAFRKQVLRVWRHWLSRRSQCGLSWARFWALLKRFPLPPARIVHSVYRPAAPA